MSDSIHCLTCTFRCPYGYTGKACEVDAIPACRTAPGGAGKLTGGLLISCCLTQHKHAKEWQQLKHSKSPSHAATCPRVLAGILAHALQPLLPHAAPCCAVLCCPALPAAFCSNRIVLNCACFKQCKAYHCSEGPPEMCDIELEGRGCYFREGVPDEEQASGQADGGNWWLGGAEVLAWASAV